MDNLQRLSMEEAKDKGTKAFQSGDFNSAERLYGEAIEIGSKLGADVSALYSNRSVALLRLGETLGTQTLRLALAEAEKCIASKPDWNKGYFRKGEVYFALKEYENAVAAYQQSLDKMPDPHIQQRFEEARQAISGFYFRQLLAGKELCTTPKSPEDQQVFAFASQMANYIYIVGDMHTKECMVVDAAWDVMGILRVVQGMKLKLVGAVVTHYHFDHTGGVPPPPYDSTGIRVSGIKDLADAGIPVYVNKCDAEAVEKKNEVPRECIHALEHGDVITVGKIRMKTLHTPGHTPGSMCLYIDGSTDGGTADGNGMLISGDTLFPGSCGRLDLPDSDCGKMHNSLQMTLATLPDIVRVYPGHNYGGSVTTIGAEKRSGMLKTITKIQWMNMHSQL